jgi:hypothetical protein
MSEQKVHDALGGKRGVNLHEMPEPARALGFDRNWASMSNT